jgi:predicted naringenin-chalcone synthase
VSKVFLKAGINSKRTFLPAWLNPVYAESPLTDMDAAAEEAKMVTTALVSDLLDKTGLKPTDIDILVTNCSIYCPTPSMASMVVSWRRFFSFRRRRFFAVGGAALSSSSFFLAHLLTKTLPPPPPPPQF